MATGPARQPRSADSLALRLLRGARMLRVGRLRAKPFRCPLCGPSVLLRLHDDEIAVRCLRCGATPIAMSLADTLLATVDDLRDAAVYELSARGPLHRFLRRRARSVVASQYVEGVAPGAVVDGVRVEDVQRLSFADASFDVCTATEVFEHVADDRRGFAEIFRVLRPGGALLFTVPLDLRAATRERARLVGGEIVHLAPAQYHRDPALAHAPILAFRDYGADIVERLREARFAQAAIVEPRERWFGYARPVIVARRG